MGASPPQKHSRFKIYILFLDPLKTNTSPEQGPFQKESSLPTVMYLSIFNTETYPKVGK